MAGAAVVVVAAVAIEAHRTDFCRTATTGTTRVRRTLDTTTTTSSRDHQRRRRRRRSPVVPGTGRRRLRVSLPRCGREPSSRNVFHCDRNRRRFMSRSPYSPSYSQTIARRSDRPVIATIRVLEKRKKSNLRCCGDDENPAKRWCVRRVKTLKRKSAN